MTSFWRACLTKPGQIWCDQSKLAFQTRNEVTKHMAGGRVPVEQKNNRGIRRTRLSIKDVNFADSLKIYKSCSRYFSAERSCAHRYDFMAVTEQMKIAARHEFDSRALWTTQWVPSAWARWMMKAAIGVVGASRWKQLVLGPLAPHKNCDLTLRPIWSSGGDLEGFMDC